MISLTAYSIRETSHLPNYYLKPYIDNMVNSLLIWNVLTICIKIHIVITKNLIKELRFFMSIISPNINDDDGNNFKNNNKRTRSDSMSNQDDEIYQSINEGKRGAGGGSGGKNCQDCKRKDEKFAKLSADKHQLESDIQNRYISKVEVNEKYIYKKELEEKYITKERHLEEIENKKREYKNIVRKIQDESTTELELRLNQQKEELGLLHQQEITQLKQKHARDIEELEIRLNNEHQQAISNLTLQHERVISDQEANHQQVITELKQGHKQDTEELETKHSDKVIEINNTHKQQVDKITTDFETKITSLNNELTTSRNQVTNLTSCNSSLEMHLDYSKRELSLAINRLTTLTNIQEEISLDADNKMPLTIPVNTLRSQVDYMAKMIDTFLSNIKMHATNSADNNSDESKMKQIGGILQNVIDLFNKRVQENKEKFKESTLLEQEMTTLAENIKEMKSLEDVNEQLKSMTVKIDNFETAVNENKQIDLEPVVEVINGINKKLDITNENTQNAMELVDRSVMKFARGTDYVQEVIDRLGHSQEKFEKKVNEHARDFYDEYSRELREVSKESLGYLRGVAIKTESYIERAIEHGEDIRFDYTKYVGKMKEDLNGMHNPKLTKTMMDTILYSLDENTTEKLRGKVSPEKIREFIGAVNTKTYNIQATVCKVCEIINYDTALYPIVAEILVEHAKVQGVYVMPRRVDSKVITNDTTIGHLLNKKIITLTPVYSESTGLGGLFTVKEYDLKELNKHNPHLVEQLYTDLSVVKASDLNSLGVEGLNYLTQEFADKVPSDDLNDVMYYFSNACVYTLAGYNVKDEEALDLEMIKFVREVTVEWSPAKVKEDLVKLYSQGLLNIEKLVDTGIKRTYVGLEYGKEYLVKNPYVVKLNNETGMSCDVRYSSFNLSYISDNSIGRQLSVIKQDLMNPELSKSDVYGYGGVNIFDMIAVGFGLLHTTGGNQHEESN